MTEISEAEKVAAVRLRDAADRLDEQARRMRAKIVECETSARKCRESADELDPPKPPAPVCEVCGGAHTTVCGYCGYHHPNEPRHDGDPENEHYQEGTPKEAEVVDLVAALRASVDAARARRVRSGAETEADRG